MSFQKAVSYRYPDSLSEFGYPEPVPKVGDRLWRKSEAWEVVEVKRDAGGKFVVVLSHVNPQVLRLLSPA